MTLLNSTLCAISKMKDILPHIKIGTSAEGLIRLSIEDYEIFDYIEDYLSEQCDVQYEYMSESDNPEEKVFTMHFSDKYSISEIQAHLLKLEPKHLEEIYSLNNSSYAN